MENGDLCFEHNGIDTPITAFRRLVLLMAWLTMGDELNLELVDLLRRSSRLDQADDAAADEIVGRTYEILYLLADRYGISRSRDGGHVDLSGVQERLLLWRMIQTAAEHNKGGCSVSAGTIQRCIEAVENLAPCKESPDCAECGDAAEAIFANLEDLFLHDYYWASGGAKYAGTAFGTPQVG